MDVKVYDDPGSMCHTVLVRVGYQETTIHAGNIQHMIEDKVASAIAGQIMDALTPALFKAINSIPKE